VASDFEDVTLPYRDGKKGYGGKITRSQFDAADIRDVPIRDLHAVQHTVRKSRVQHYVERGGKGEPDDVSKNGFAQDLPIVVASGGVLYLHNGHHRVEANRILGNRTVRARVVRVPRPGLQAWAERE
jgi:hypothetical protein